MGALTLYLDLVQGSNDWLEARRGIVTASVVGQLITPTLKVASNETARGLLRTLVAERITGWIEPTFQNLDMLRGQMDEPLARDLYTKTYAPVRELGFMVRDIGGDRIGYSPDGLVGDDGLIEVKSAKPKIHLARILGAPIEHDHMAQMQAGLLVSGREWCDYLSYCGGMPMWRERVEADNEWREAIKAALVAFELAATAMFATYLDTIGDLPPTERIEYFPEASV